MSDKIKAVVYCRIGNVETPKAAIYCRVASADDFAIRSQEETLRSFAAGQMLAVGGVYSDNGANGLTLDRPALREMISAVKRGEINCIIVKNINRISRDFLGFGQWLDDMRGRNVRVIAVDDSYDSRDDSGLFDPTFRDLIGQMLRENMSVRIKRGVANSRQCQAANLSL